jgi:hypothetical protein
MIPKGVLLNPRRSQKKTTGPKFSRYRIGARTMAHAIRVLVMRNLGFMQEMVAFISRQSRHIPLMQDRADEREENTEIADALAKAKAHALPDDEDLRKTEERKLSHLPVVDHDMRIVTWWRRRTLARIGKADPDRTEVGRVGSPAALEATVGQVARIESAPIPTRS